MLANARGFDSNLSQFSEPRAIAIGIVLEPISRRFIESRHDIGLILFGNHTWQFQQKGCKVI